MMPQPGRYTVTAPERAVYESRNGALIFAAKCVVDEQAGIGITAYQTLVQKDGTLSERTIQALRDIFAWDGVDPLWLQDADLGAVQFDITVEPDEDQNGKPTVRVSWLNPVGQGGGPVLTKGDRNAILAKYGAKFRAVAGGAQIPRPVARLAAPRPVPAAPAQQPPSVPESSASMEDAWKALCSAPNAPLNDRAALSERWHALVREHGGGRPQDAMTPEDWGRVKDAAAKAWGEDDIPFA